MCHKIPSAIEQRSKDFWKPRAKIYSVRFLRIRYPHEVAHIAHIVLFLFIDKCKLKSDAAFKLFQCNGEIGIGRFTRNFRVLEYEAQHRFVYKYFNCYYSFSS